MNDLNILNYIVLSIGVSLFALLIYTAVISYLEAEKYAFKRALTASFIFPAPYILTGLLSFPFQNIVSYILLSVVVLFILVFVVPLNNKKLKNEQAVGKIDERNTMFSRNELVPGTENFNNYYKDHPEHKETDDNFRKRFGLMSEKSQKYNPWLFASADANFVSVEAFHPYTEGKVEEKKITAEPEKMTKYIKEWVKRTGAIDVGITELKEYHKYSHHGRGERYGKEVKIDHKYAIAFTVEMNKEMLDSAPGGTTLVESAQQYLTVGTIAAQLAIFIRKLGHPASAHIDAHYSVVCPLVAKDAGLGELGRMGLLMTKKLGPRVRIAVVTTDIELVTDKPSHDPTVIDFCNKCMKCAEICPSKAISFNDRENIKGVTRWQIDQEACFNYWCIVGTDCGQCMRICPYSHPNNFLHNIVRFGTGNSKIFRTLAVFLDDMLYSRKPKPFKEPDWVIEYKNNLDK